MIYFILCCLLFLVEAWLESYVIALKKVEDFENPGNFEKLNKAEHYISALFSCLIILVIFIPIWGNWFLMLSLIPLRRIFFDTPLPIFINVLKPKSQKVLVYTSDKGVDGFLKGVFYKRWIELATELAYVILMLTLHIYQNDGFPLLPK